MRKKKITYWMIALILLSLTTCQPQKEKPIDSHAQPAIWVTPQIADGMVFYDGCTHMLAYPAELQADGSGMLFEHPDNPDVQVYFGSRRRFDSEIGLDLSTIAEGIAAKHIADPQIVFSSMFVKDYLGKQEPALLGDSAVESSRVQILVTILPDYLFMDMVKDDVIYYVVARAPQDEWNEWEPKFLLMFNNFVPKECGGV